MAQLASVKTGHRKKHPLVTEISLSLRHL